MDEIAELVEKMGPTAILQTGIRAVMESTGRFRSYLQAISVLSIRNHGKL